jgi:serine/threonine-protein kinase
MGEASASQAALVGRTIAGKFVLESLIGSGAMGDVFMAKHSALDVHVALKIMREDLAKDPRFVERFQREAKAASKLNHPNSVRVIDFGQESDGLVYIAMEYLEGRDLLRVINEDWPLPPERIAAVISQALGALAVAHDQGIIHRDLKPENIMIVPGTDDEGNAIDIVKVCDFGIAKISDSRSFQTEKGKGPALTQTGSLIGTPEYMSPEQARGDSLDVRSDLYSMGVVLYQLLCADLPFKADNALGVVLKVVTDDPKKPSTIRAGVHPGLESVCMRAMQKVRGERFQTAKEMRGALRDALGLKSAAPWVDSLSAPIGAKIPSSGDDIARAAALRMSNAPTLDISSAPPPAAQQAISDPPPADQDNSRPLSLGPKETSPGTALAPQVEVKRGGFGGVVVAVLAIAALIVGAIFLVPRLQKHSNAVAAAPPSASSVTDLEPIITKDETTFASPLGSDSAKPPLFHLPPGAVGGASASHSGRSHHNGAPATSASATPAFSAATPPPSFSSTPPPSAPDPHQADTAPTFNAQRARVELGLANVSGVKPGPVRAAFHNAQSQLNACYRDALTKQQTRIEGAVTFDLSISPSAVIASPVVTGIDKKYAELSQCFQRAIAQKQLPPTALEEPSGATAQVWVSLKPD